MDPRRIGRVIGVAGDNVTVAVTADDFNIRHGSKTHRIGRIGSYVAIPMRERTIIGYTTGMIAAGPESVQHAAAELTAQMLGTIEDGRFSRGVNQYPICGDPVRIAVDEDFKQIFGSFEAETTSGAGDPPLGFCMGKFATDTDFNVNVLGKEFFAKHIAVMGNSGAGKSVTTAKILYEASRLPHAQVVVFDMHGEYLHAFTDDRSEPLPNVTYLSDRNLVLPYWLLSYEEFEQLFIDGSDTRNVNAQKIFLRQALEKLKLQSARELNLHGEFTIDTPIFYSLEHLLMYAQNMNDARFVTNTENYAFSRLQYRQLPVEEQERLLITQRMEFNPAASEGETPHATFNGKLLGLINAIESALTDRRYDFLLRPFVQAGVNADLSKAFNPKAGPGEKSRAVSMVIRQMLGQLERRRNLTLVDLSGLPFEVVDTTVAVLTRALFDYNFWTPVERRQPVLLVFEEAHNYLPRKPIEGRKTFARNAVEKVAKEGRKYGVSAMIVSQRPSEISETVLSQCNSMVLMRMNNPDDQEYAARVVSDQFRSLINMLPSMRPGEGFVIGDAVLMPMRTLIDMPPKLPQSGNMDFFRLWHLGGREGDVDQTIERWWRQQRSAGTQSESEDGTSIWKPASPAPAPAPSKPAARPENGHFFPDAASRQAAPPNPKPTAPATPPNTTPTPAPASDGAGGEPVGDGLEHAATNGADSPDDKPRVVASPAKPGSATEKLARLAALLSTRSDS